MPPVAPPKFVKVPKNWPCELHRLISLEQDDIWESVLDRLKSNPEDVSFQGPHFGQTSLHVACIRYPPLAVIQALLGCAPQTALLQNNNGETALHISCNCSSHEVQLELIRAAPQAASLLDKYGESSLHIAARNGCTMEVMEELLKAAPSAVAVKNKQGITPFCLLSRGYVEAESLEDVEDDDLIDDWEASLLFLRATAPCPTTPLVHAAAMSPSCPRPLLMMLLKFYPEQTMMYDEAGKIPLHYAASTDVIKEPAVWNETEDGYRDSQQELQTVNITLERADLREYVHLEELVTEDPNDSVLLLVVNCNPQAARLADAEGRLPLALALLSNKAWKEELQHLVWAAPQALETRDPVTHLYPFQLAALYCQDLDTIYHVVRSLPQNLAMGIGDSDI